MLSFLGSVAGFIVIVIVGFILLALLGKMDIVKDDEDDGCLVKIVGFAFVVAIICAYLHMCSEALAD